MREITGNRALRLALWGGIVSALLAMPQVASAHSRRHVFKPDDAIVRGATQAVDGSGAPEIDPSVLGSGAALLAGGLAVLATRRRSRR
jgi:hypothetical protein